MMVMTAKVDFKKVMMIVGGIALVILALLMLFGGSSDAEATVAPAITTNDGRVAFLKEHGWEVATSPVESGQVKIPTQTTEVFDRYNALQKSQGYDLTQYAGKTVMRFVYKVNNYPNATEPVYATVLVYKNQIIGGDITDTAAGGKMRPFASTEQGTPDTEQTPDTTMVS